MDDYKNFAYSTVATAPSPAVSGTSLTLAAGTGALFPVAPFNVTVWPTAEAPLAGNAEIMRVTARTGDVLTVTRAQEGTSARTVVVADQIAATITEKTLEDLLPLSGGTMAGPLTVATGDASGIRLSANSSITASSLNANTIAATAGGSGHIYLTTLGTGNIAIQSQNGLSLESVTQYIQVRSELDMGYDKITSLGTPTDTTDATTKQYVDDRTPEIVAQSTPPGDTSVIWIDTSSS